MLVSRRGLSGLALSLLAATALASCGTSPATVVSEAQALVNDAASILALGLVPTAKAAIAQAVVSGLQALLAAVSGALATGASTESTAITALTSATKSLQADVPTTSTIYTDAGTALTLLEALGANATASAQAQAEGAVGAALIAYLELNSAKSVSRGGAASPAGALFAEARGHVANLQAQ